uniref:Uncharacterized protein n=1 Tax=Ciona intestinalis TaxID=7719 RepID=H2XR68_CIOIN
MNNKAFGYQDIITIFRLLFIEASSSQINFYFN